METFVDLLGTCRLQEQLDRFVKILPRLFDRIALTGNIQFRTDCNVSVPFSLD